MRPRGRAAPKLKCKFCGTDTVQSVWTKGTKRIFVPICNAAKCWDKYWKLNDQ